VNTPGDSHPPLAQQVREEVDTMSRANVGGVVNPDRTEVYAPTRTVENLSECWFYHTMDLPGHGTVEGAWDLRDGVDAYLGGVDVQGKRALDVGTASGFLCLERER